MNLFSLLCALPLIVSAKPTSFLDNNKKTRLCHVDQAFKPSETPETIKACKNVSTSSKPLHMMRAGAVINQDTPWKRIIAPRTVLIILSCSMASFGIPGLLNPNLLRAICGFGGDLSEEGTLFLSFACIRETLASFLFFIASRRASDEACQLIVATFSFFFIPTQIWILSRNKIIEVLPFEKKLVTLGTQYFFQAYCGLSTIMSLLTKNT